MQSESHVQDSSTLSACLCHNLGVCDQAHLKFGYSCNSIFFRFLIFNDWCCWYDNTHLYLLLLLLLLLFVVGTCLLLLLLLLLLHRATVLN